MPGGFIPSVINGGGGGDTLDYSNSNTAVTVNLGAYGNGTYGYATAVGSSVANIQNVIGSAYNDVLTGSSYGNVLVGDGGNDTINGGTGRSILIGGTGADTINGRSGNDLIISGSTAYDLNPTALDAIFAEWDSTDSYSQRVQYLSGPTGHFNGGYFLIPAGTNKTVTDDGIADAITAVAGNNWIIIGTGDTVHLN
jgi:Ca2+-binding RTX toxin-like protein